MKQAILDLLSTKKGVVYVTNALVLLGNMLAGILGYEVDPVKLGTFVALSASWLVSQGLADNGKAAAQLHLDAANMMVDRPIAVVERPAEAGFVRLGLLMVIVMVGAIAGCAWLKSEGKAVATDVIDCTKGAAPGAIKEFGPALDALLVYATDAGGKLNGAAVKDASRSFAKEVGGCVLADAVARALAPAPARPDAPKSSPLEVDPASLRETFSEVRAQLGGKVFHTAHGDV